MISEPLSAPLARLADTLRPLADQRIALIAPAGGVKDKRIDAALAVMQAAGIDAVLGAHARDRHRYLAGTVEARLADLHAAFELPNIDAVWCLRGGYGSAHLIEHIDWPRLPGNVPLIGFSDITTLLEAFRQRGRRAIHGPVATQLAVPGETAADQDERAASMASLVDLLQGRKNNWPLTHVAGPSSSVSGRLVGGNLTTLASVAGTAAAPRLESDSILVLEDVGEAEFRLERALHQTLASIDIKHLRAVCLGHFEQCALANGMTSLADILNESLAPIGVPLYKSTPTGHGLINHAWPCGRTTHIDRARLVWVDD